MLSLRQFVYSPQQLNQPFYLLEVQIQPDEEPYHRLFVELFLYLRQYRPVQPWQIVVTYCDCLKLIIEPEDQALETARNLISQIEQEAEIILKSAFLELIKTIIIYKFPERTREEITTMPGLGDLT